MLLADYLGVLRRGWLPIVLAVGVAALLSVAYLDRTEPVYESSAQVLVAPRGATTVGDLQQGAQLASSSVETIARLVTSRAVLQPVAQDTADEAVLYGTDPVDLGELTAAVSALGDPSNAVLTVVARSSSPERAARLARLVADSAVTSVPDLLARSTSGAGRLLSLQVVEPPSVPGAPVSPNARGVLVLGLAAGLVLGLAIALARHALDTRVRTAEDVRRTTELPLLGVLPRRSRRNPAPIDVDGAASGQAVEAHRSLRAAVGEPSADGWQSLLVLPAEPDRRSFWVPVNLAWSWANSGRRVLLLDLDLREGALADEMGVAGPSPVAGVLAGTHGLDEAVAPTQHELLDVVAGGPTAADPFELLTARAVSGLLRQAEQQYDVVVVNAPAASAWTESTVVARAATHVVVTLRAGRTRAERLRGALDGLAGAGVEPSGVVLTGAPVRVSESFRHQRYALGRRRSLAPNRLRTPERSPGGASQADQHEPETLASDGERTLVGRGDDRT